MGTSLWKFSGGRQRKYDMIEVVLKDLETPLLDVSRTLMLVCPVTQTFQNAGRVCVWPFLAYNIWGTSVVPGLT